MSEIQERKVLLTPECQSLWVVSPAILFFYDKVIIDERDFSWMLNPKSETKLTVRRAEILKSLKEWGLIETISYESYLSPKIRQWVHSESKRLVEKSLPKEKESFYDSQFVSRSLHAHKEFSKYVENVILFCDPDDDVFLHKNIERLTEVNKRIKALQENNATDDMLEEIKWTLERIIAKSFAGLIIASKTNPNGMYDTDEYRPFIDDILSLSPELSSAFQGDIKTQTLGIILGALSEKQVPDISLWDQSEFFRLLRSRTEFIRLRNTLKKIEKLYGELLIENEELVRKKIQIDIRCLENEFEKNLKAARDNFLSKCTWRGWEMIASVTSAGVANPLIRKAKELSDIEYEQKIKNQLFKRGGLKAGLFFVSDIWKRRLQFLYLPKPKRDKSFDEEVPIWGKGNLDIPWYEKQF